MPLLLRANSFPTSHSLWRNSTFIGGNLTDLYNSQKILHAKSHTVRKFCTKAFARRKLSKKLRKSEQPQNGSIALQTTDKSSVDETEVLQVGVPSEENQVMSVENSPNIPSRSTVLRACTVTSGLIAALGILIRQGSHVASTEGLPIIDCSAQVSFGVETWHLELITGLVILISSCRYFLLKTWPEFAESSATANQQVLTSLEPLDYIIVSFLPGVSEELLFRGALLPLFGMNWISVLVVATIFGVLHLGSGRKFSFAAWASFVGLVYGYATIASSSVIVAMASHSLNNLVGGILWLNASKSQKDV